MVEFKAFLRNSLGDSQAIVDTIWGRVKLSGLMLAEPRRACSHPIPLRKAQAVRESLDGTIVEISIAGTNWLRKQSTPNLDFSPSTIREIGQQCQ